MGVGERVWAGLAVTLLTAWIPLGAMAQETEGAAPEEAAPSPAVVREARAYFELAHAQYDAGRYEEAIRGFERSYDLLPHAELLYNLHLAYRDAGNVERAVDTLRRYLAAASDVAPGTRQTLERRLAAMEAALAASGNAPGEPEPPSVDDPRQLSAPELEPAPEAEAEAEPVAEAEEPDPEPAPPPAGSNDGLITGAITSFSVAGAGLLVMAITGPLALVERDQIVGTCSPTCSDAQLSTPRSLGIATDVGLGVASAAAALGTVLLAVALTSSSETVTVVPSVSTDHAGIVMGGWL